MRIILTILACAIVAPVSHGDPDPGAVQQLTLDRRKPIEIRVGAKVATTLQFPRPLQGIFGYGLTEGNAPGAYHFAHPAGSRLLTLRNLLPGKETFVTVLLGEEDLFVLHLKPTDDPPVAVRLRDPVDEDALWRARPIDPEDAEARKLDHDTARLFNLLKIGKNERVFRAALPHLYEDAESRKVEFRHDDGKIATLVTRLHRFPVEDALFLSAHIENKTEQIQQFDPGSVQVMVGSRTYPAALVDSAAQIPAGEKIPLHVIIRGGVEGERAHLSIKNEYRLIMPAYSPCTHDPALTDQLGFMVEPPDGIYIQGDSRDSGPSAALFPESATKIDEEKGGSK